MKRSVSLPRKSSLLRKGRLKPVSRKKVSERVLTKLCRRLVVELRDQNTCQRCGSTTRKLEWAHVKTRNAPSLIYVPWNSLALCGPRINLHTCHGWFDSNKETGMEWWQQTFPERALALKLWEHNRRKPKIDRALDKAWLEQEIAKYGVGVSV